MPVFNKVEASSRFIRSIFFAMAFLGMTVSDGNTQAVPEASDSTQLQNYTATQDSTLYLPLARTPEEYGMFVPLFIYPQWWLDNPNQLADEYAWDDVAALRQVTKKVQVILSPTGSDGSVQPINEDYTRGIADLEAAGVRMSGYNDTNYGTRPIAEILTDANRYFDEYPDSVVCCMLDQVFANDTDPAQLDEMFAHYQNVVTQLKNVAAQKSKKLEVIFNPGQRIDQRFYTLADKTIIFEGTFTDWMQYQPDDYILLNPIKAIVLVHTTPTEAEMQQAINRAESFKIQQIYVGSGMKAVGPEPQDPWTELPAYLQAEAAYIQGLN